MKVLFLTLGPPVLASSRTRVFQYLPFLGKEGIRYKVIISRSELSYRLSQICRSDDSMLKWIRKSQLYLMDKFDKLLFYSQIMRFAFLAMFYNIIFIQKVLIPTFILELIARMFRKKIVFDLDDALYVVLKPCKKRRFERQLSLCDLVVVENTFTEEYVRKFTSNSILVLTGPIDCKRYYPNQIERDDVIVGWIGSRDTQVYLNMLENVFTQLSHAHKNLIFEFVGAQSLGFSKSPFRQKRWSLNTEVADLQNFDIGIMPLPDDEWTRGKGGYKLLQYMATGIPCVASPRGINKELIKDGVNGFLAATEEQWYEKLSFLIENPQLRIQMGRSGRDIVVKNYSFDVAAPKFISALEQLTKSGKEC